MIEITQEKHSRARIRHNKRRGKSPGAKVGNYANQQKFNQAVTDRAARKAEKSLKRVGVKPRERAALVSVIGEARGGSTIVARGKVRKVLGKREIVRSGAGGDDGKIVVRERREFVRSRSGGVVSRRSGGAGGGETSGGKVSVGLSRSRRGSVLVGAGAAGAALADLVLADEAAVYRLVNEGAGEDEVRGFLEIRGGMVGAESGALPGSVDEGLAKVAHEAVGFLGDVRSGEVGQRAALRQRPDAGLYGRGGGLEYEVREFERYVVELVDEAVGGSEVAEVELATLADEAGADVRSLLEVVAVDSGVVLDDLRPAAMNSAGSGGDDYGGDDGEGRRPCDTSDQRARDGSICGGRAATVRKGGREPMGAAFYAENVRDGRLFR